MITDHKSCTRLAMNIELDKAVFVILSATSAKKRSRFWNLLGFAAQDLLEIGINLKFKHCAIFD